MTMCFILYVSKQPKSEKPDIEKNKFCDELVHKWDMKGTKELTLGIKVFNDHVGKRRVDLRVYMGEIELESEIWKVECCWNPAIKRI